jgi:hypothetical protein
MIAEQLAGLLRFHVPTFSRSIPPTFQFSPVPRPRSIIIPEQSSRLLKQPLAVSNREDYLSPARPSIVRGRFSTFKHSDVQTACPERSEGFKRFHAPTFHSPIAKR